MKRFLTKSIYIVLSIYLVFGGLAIARAEEQDASTTSITTDTVREEKAVRREKAKRQEAARDREKRGEIQEATQERKAIQQKKLTEKRKTQIRAFWQRMEKRLYAAIRRQENLADRIGTRLDKIEKTGRNVSALRVKLAGAREAVKQARLSLETARVKFDAMLANDGDLKELFQDVKTLVGSVSEKVKQAHEKLVDVISAIKKGRLDSMSQSATSTSN